MASRHVVDFDAPPAVPPDELARRIGGKGANLVVMASELGLPVPPGFTITTEACAAFLRGTWPDGLDNEIRDAIHRLEWRVGRRFGDATDPLLVSVRSGAPVSMPGMMDTVLNLGLTEVTAAGLATATGDAAFAADCQRRFQESYREVIGGDAVPDDPWEQLRAATEAVFASWNSDRARAYRSREGIAEDLGTAVTVQAMVFGNRGDDSGTGVLFTRNPSTGEAVPYGDLLFDAQGEDVVAGGHKTLPIAALDDRLPEVAAELRRCADRLERHYADCCDIEFTIERRRLWLLQVRVGKRSPRAALRMAAEMAADETFPLSREEAVRRVEHLLADPPGVFVPSPGRQPAVASGLPASPGVATGAIVTSTEAALREADAGRPVILVRADTSPEDVPAMARAAGILTARGGLASHAAVVARGWGIPAVVGADAVWPGEDAVRLGDRSLPIGEEITIDGGTGEVFVGAVEGRWEVPQEVGPLLAWARELGIDLDAVAQSPGAVMAEDANGAPAIADPTADDLLRALLVKGAAAPDQFGDILGVEDGVTPLVGPMVARGLAELAGDTLRLTDVGREQALGAVAADRAELGDTATTELLERFHPFDERIKTIVTAWQLRDIDGQQTLNDHADAAYDAQILGDLAALHREFVDWLAPLAASLRRYAVYRVRLSRAVGLARSGDQRYVASPRVDSYHSVWFELHEDLIRLAGRLRSNEASAGRA